MIARIALVISFAVGLKYFIVFRKWLDLDKDFMYRVAPGPCKQVFKEGGSEDIVHVGDGIFVVSTGFSFEGAAGPGEIKILNTNGREPIVYTANITNRPTRKDFLTAPHGLSSWRDPKTGVVTVYLLTHPVTEDRVEAFEIQRNGNLKHIRSITDPKFKYMNSLVLVDKDKFYITKFSEYGEIWKMYLDMIMPSWGEVYYYDGSKARLVAEGFHLTNGINTSPDGSILYVAESLGKKINAYRRDRHNNLHKLWDVATIPDNIRVDPNTGDLWIGCHPIVYQSIDFYNLFNFKLPGQVIKVTLVDDMVNDVIEVYADQGDEISGTTVAAYYNGKMAVGTVSKQMIVCDVKYTD